jgi:hypothetical protein
VEGTIEQLFEGHHINYIECINVDYKSNRKESFYGRTCHSDCVCIECAISIYCVIVTYVLALQIYNLMSKVVVMFMHHLINMSKWSV